MTKVNLKQFLNFGVVGGVGFIVDASILYLLIKLFAFHPLTARPFSFLVAVTATWYLNRNITFSERKNQIKTTEWFRYLSANGLGAVLNFIIYTLLLIAWPMMAPVLALAIASALALIINFLSSRYLVFVKMT